MLEKNIEDNFVPGALEDLRSDEEKARDYKQEEIVSPEKLTASAAALVWTKKAAYRTFPKRMQNGSGSCVIQADQKERGIIAQQKYGTWIDFSAVPGFKSRDYPIIGTGSSKVDAIRDAKNGSIPEILLPSQSMTDKQMLDSVLPGYFGDMAKNFGTKYVDVAINIDAIASTIEATGKGVGIWLRFGSGEWFYNFDVKEILTGNYPWGHKVVAIDYTLNDKGEKCLIIDDSACEDGHQYRRVNESFLLNRCFLAHYMVSFRQFAEKTDKPIYDPNSIKSLQDCLKYEGCFPANQDSTGNFGSITKSAVITFQLRYGLKGDGVVGALTKSKLTSLYS